VKPRAALAAAKSIPPKDRQERIHQPVPAAEPHVVGVAPRASDDDAFGSFHFCEANCSARGERIH
jgi:hypothetical protein